METKSNNLNGIVENHQGFLSDKWEQYFEVYEFHFSAFQESPISFVEIGVQNGGSLEIWAKYFEGAKLILGLDIDSRVETLKFDDSRIKTLIVDASQMETRNKLIDYSNYFEILIDDGSHLNTDIIHTFFNLWEVISPGGIYVVEDLHTAYWDSHQGGFRSKNSAIEFFKTLVDIVNFNYWGINIDINDFFEKDSVASNLCSSLDFFKDIDCITFYDSMVIVKKKKENSNLIRYISGKIVSVDTEIKNLHGHQISTPQQYSNSRVRLKNPYTSMSEIHSELENIKSSRSWRFTKYFRIAYGNISTLKHKIFKS